MIEPAGDFHGWLDNWPRVNESGTKIVFFEELMEAIKARKDASNATKEAIEIAKKKAKWTAIWGNGPKYIEGWTKRKRKANPCKKCGVIKNTNERCKNCHNIYTRNWRAKHPEHRQTVEYKEKAIAKTRAWQQKNKDKMDEYAAGHIISMATGIPQSQIPHQLVKTKAAHLRLKRLLKAVKYNINNINGH